MKTEQTTGKEIDFRKDTPPTDWLMKRVEERYSHLPVADIKLPVDYHKEFISELAELRCEPGCTNGNGNADAGGSGNADANGQLGVRCICSLLREMACEEAPLVPKGEFMAVVGAAGCSQEDALERYRNYAWTKLHDEHKQEFRRLVMERQNAHNWWVELDSDEARAQATAAGNELSALRHQVNENLEAAMSA